MILWENLGKIAFYKVSTFREFISDVVLFLIFIQDPDDEDIGQKSILDKDPEAQAILELAGKERKSEGLREQDADIPEIHRLPPM